MSILIKGADISPDHIQCITVFPEGFAIVEEYDMLVPIKIMKCEVAPVPTPHGRLVDADELLKDSETIILETIDDHEEVEEMIRYAPTVIKAEESK